MPGIIKKIFSFIKSIFIKVGKPIGPINDEENFQNTIIIRHCLEYCYYFTKNLIYMLEFAKTTNYRILN